MPGIIFSLFAKNNIGKDNYGYAYRLEGDKPGVCKPVYEEDPIDMTAQQFAETLVDAPTKRDAAADWLRGQLADEAADIRPERGCRDRRR